jgi:hypothetical protein
MDESKLSNAQKTFVLAFGVLHKCFLPHSMNNLNQDELP